MSQRLLGFLFLVLFSVGAAFGQVDTGAISGVVTDATGAAIPGATVTATNDGTNAVRTVKTAGNGTYQLGSLPAAVYKVSITAPGFATQTAQVEVTVGGHAPLDAKLLAGGNAVTVEVESLGGSQVNTNSDEISEIITPQQVSQFPSLTRNVYDFVAIAGNVSNGDTAQGHSQNSTNLGVGFSINGQRSSGTEILLDGVENTELFDDVVGIHVPIDSIAEYRVTTSNFEPQYGRASGGVVNVVTASGSNRFHGTVSEFNRLAAYTANSVTNALEGTPKGGYTRNQFGFFVSGPVVRDKLFFAAGSEWLRVRSSANLPTYLLTPEVQSYLAPAVQSFLTQYGQTFTFASTLTNAQAGQAANPSNPNATPCSRLFPRRRRCWAWSTTRCRRTRAVACRRTPTTTPCAGTTTTRRRRRSLRGTSAITWRSLLERRRSALTRTMTLARRRKTFPLLWVRRTVFRPRY